MHQGFRPLMCGVTLALAVVVSAIPAMGQGRDSLGGARDSLAGLGLAQLSLEQLSNVPVTSVSRRNEHLSDAAASVYVITAEDIRRSGAKTLPEALRLAPTIEVARADANQYAISARGFISVLANKMLVLIDGRTVYSPLFSGTFWEEPDLVLADVDRIEVISGPGGTSWGTNAVNGVINVISRPVVQSKGLIVAGGGGDQVRVGEARYGWGSGPFFKVSGKYIHQADNQLANGAELDDASERSWGGARARWTLGGSTFALDGSAYKNQIDQPLDARKLSGGHVLASWLRQPSQGPMFRLRGYYARARRDQPGAILDVLDTYDLEFQNDWSGAHNSFVWGAGYRYQPDRTNNPSPSLAFIPADRNLESEDLFAEDVIEFHPRVHVTAGVRLERNVYTGWEALPSVRASWRPMGTDVVWVALSRAVRAPSRVDRELFSPASPPHPFLAGGPTFESELLHAAELGFRAQPFHALSYSVAGFVDGYERLRSLEPTPSGPAFENRIRGVLWGFESWVNYRVVSAWRVSAGAAGQRHDYELTPGSADLGQKAQLEIDPDLWWTVRNSLDIGDEGEFDVIVRHVGGLPVSQVPAYTTAGARVAWRFFRGMEVSVTGNDLVGPRHAEWGSGNRVTFGPSVLGQLEWRP